MENQKQPFTSVEKVAAENSLNIQRQTPVQEFHFNKLAYLKPETLLKKRLQHRCFAVSFSKFFWTAIFNCISRSPPLVAYKHE